MKKLRMQNLKILVEVIVSYDKNGADILGLQEIENMNIFEQQLFLLLNPMVI